MREIFFANIRHCLRNAKFLTVFTSTPFGIDVRTVAPIFADQTIEALRIGAYQLNVKAETQAVVDLIEPAMRSIKALCNVTLQKFKLAGSQKFVLTHEYQDVVLHIALLLGTFVEPSGEQTEELVVRLVLLFEVVNLTCGVGIREIKDFVVTEKLSAIYLEVAQVLDKGS